MTKSFDFVVVPRDELYDLVARAVREALQSSGSRPDIANKMLSAKEAARYLRIRNEVVLAYLKNGDIKGRLYRGQWRISMADLSAWNERQS